jgi:hypothetical protein
LFTTRNADKSVFASLASSNCLWRSEFESFEFWPKSWAILTGAAPLDKGAGALTWFPPKPPNGCANELGQGTGALVAGTGEGWTLPPALADGSTFTGFPPKPPNGCANKFALGAGALSVGAEELKGWTLPTALAD